jgi:hypothetical protein
MTDDLQAEPEQPSVHTGMTVLQWVLVTML